MKTLSGKIIVVTGASRGIGRAIAESCAHDGAIVGVNYLNSHDAAESLRTQFPSTVELLKFDVGDYQGTQVAISEFIKRHGRLDVLVNNAGIFRPHLLISQRNLDKAHEEFRINTFGAMGCTQVALPYMVKNKGGIIVNISSCAVTQPQAGQATYAASKAAIEAYSRAVAVEYAKKGVRCICLRLGPVDTDMLRGAVGDIGMKITMPEHVLLKRLLTPAEIAESLRSVLTTSVAMATGSTLDFTAGYTLG